MSTNKYESPNLLSFSIIADRDDVIAQPVPKNDDFVEAARALYAKACAILEQDNIGPWYFGHVSNLADELFNFLNLVEMEGVP
jgi:hypothetical protein